MFVAFFVMVAALLVAPVRPAPQGLKPPDVEQQWYDELQTIGRVNIDIGEGWRIEVLAKEMRGRELFNPTILIHSPMGMKTIMHPKVAELRAGQVSLLLRLDECHFSDADGARGYFESRIGVYELPPRK